MNDLRLIQPFAVSICWFFFNSFGFVLLHSISKANVTDRKGRWRVRESTIRKKKEKMRKYLLKNSKKFIGNQIVRHGGRGQSRLATNQTGGRGKEKGAWPAMKMIFFLQKRPFGAFSDYKPKRWRPLRPTPKKKERQKNPQRHLWVFMSIKNDDKGNFEFVCGFSMFDGVITPAPTTTPAVSAKWVSGNADPVRSFEELEIPLMNSKKREIPFPLPPSIFTINQFHHKTRIRPTTWSVEWWIFIN